MSPPTTTTLLLLTTLLFATTLHALPSPLQPRDSDPDKTFVDHTNAPGPSGYTQFTAKWPTCGNDASITDLNLPLSASVTVRPDCDAVIDTICEAAIREAAVPPTQQYMTSLGHQNGTCEGHILFSGINIDPASLNYEKCRAQFQSITMMCMLTDGSAGKNYAGAGHQIGMVNIMHNPYPTAQTPTWSASTHWTKEPGYMMGPLGAFGDVEGTEADSILQTLPQGSTPWWQTNWARNGK